VRIEPRHRTHSLGLTALPRAEIEWIGAALPEAEVLTWEQLRSLAYARPHFVQLTPRARDT
jgi:hypothetical protein